ncbi:RagB/SusD family nutrient uptake outer membrane protein [Aridibaculum aurantiacum]|uniref:RagB/SusD family nutrient uptake outer membrane protein n=1 Tax=Aridibaculum aurantiacum TaxID=2810307 RepID=UPI001A95A95B|nr:RagB/SusD family nutrient uptake outer membrane protein [Aridibaculum aurantiacum]
MKMNKYIVAFAALFVGLVSCKKTFLEEKNDLTGMNEQVFKDSLMAQAYIDYVYFMMLPGNNAQANIWNLAAGGNAFTQTTDELAGETNWNKEWSSILSTNAHALPYFGTNISTSVGNNTWTRMKQINMFLNEVDKHEGLSAEKKKVLKGQMFFWRAWQYFDLVRLYGGVPIVLEPQSPIGVSDNPSLQVQRSRTEDVINQIVRDLDSATASLPGKWGSADWGRVTSGTAAALKGRVLLTWASPLFNRSDDRGRWQKAYEANLAAKTLLEANGFGLFRTGGNANATAFGNMWFTEVNNPEAVFVFGFNNGTSDQTRKWNGWEHAVRPRDILGGGSVSPTKQMVDAFPMRDGKMAGQSFYTYDQNKFYKNRDPRFYRTFAYNGSLWPYSQNPNYRIWTYRWFNNATATTPTQTTEVAGANSSGVYVNKATATNASNSHALGNNFSLSGTDFMEMRFAEVLLNLAESAIGADRPLEGIDQIKAVRERAGVENRDGQFGLAGITSRDALFAAVLKERQVEFAYEGKRFWDLRRWMLFTDEFGTTARLGFQPLNGTRRTGYFISVKRADGTRYNSSTAVANGGDPLRRWGTNGANPAPIINRDSAVANFDAYLDYLYDRHFTVTEKDDLDPTANNNAWKFRWYKEYYFFGIPQNVLNSSPYLQQTIGWGGGGGSGVFDPLQ